MKILQGIDITNINRIKNLYLKYGLKFLRKILSDLEIKEITKIKSKEKIVEKTASRFAAKEAASKAIGLGFSNGVRFKHFQIFYDGFGRPEIVINDFVKRKISKSEQQITSSLTISNEKDLTIALVTIVLT
jgi:holo-[acyl-carrier protein] synthase